MIISATALEQRYRACAFTDEPQARRVAASAIERKDFYEGFGLPWWIVAVIHYRECSFNFSKHLHNGDPLTARTIRYPANRPASGMPPFTWAESARDALSDRKPPEADTIGAWLDWLERYNGLGYRRRDIANPYVWAGTDAYKSGLYVADGRFDPIATDDRVGCAAVIKALELLGALCFDAVSSSQT